MFHKSTGFYFTCSSGGKAVENVWNGEEPSEQKKKVIAEYSDQSGPFTSSGASFPSAGLSIRRTSSLMCSFRNLQYLNKLTLCSSAFSQMNTIRKSTQIFLCLFCRVEISVVSSRARKTEGPRGVIRDKMLSVFVSQSVMTSSLINGAFLWLKSDYKNHNFPV